MTSVHERPADPIQTSAHDLMEELQAVRGSVEELYLLLDHIWRNRDELREVFAQLMGNDVADQENKPVGFGCGEGPAPSDAPPAHEKTRSDELLETIACAYCDVDSPESLAAALQEGWTSLCRDDGAEWNYLGICPDCQDSPSDELDDELPPPDTQKSFFS